MNNLLAQDRTGRDPWRDKSRANVRSTAHNAGTLACSGFDRDGFVLAFSERLEAGNARRNHVVEVRADRLNAFAFGRLHCDQAFQFWSTDA